MTIARGDEIVVSERFVEMVRRNNLTGIDFNPVMGSGKQARQLNYYQIYPHCYLDFSNKTIFGQDPFNWSGVYPGGTIEYLRQDGTRYKEVFPVEKTLLIFVFSNSSVKSFGFAFLMLESAAP